MPAALAVVGVAGSIYAAKKQGDAAKDAASTQAGAAEDSNKLYWDMYQQSRSDNEPFRQNALTAQQEYMELLGLGSPAPQQAPTQNQPQFGTAGLFNGMTTGGLAQGQQIGGIGSLLRHADGDMRVTQNGFGPIMQQAINRGLVPPTGLRMTTGGPGQVSGGAPAQTKEQSQQSAFDRFRNMPGYQFGLDEQRNQLESSAAARGGLYSGKALKELSRFGINYADQQGFAPHMNRLASLAGMGQTANAQNAQMGMNTVQGMGQNLMAAGNARASGLYAQGQASAGLAQNLTGIAGMLGGYYQNRGGWG